MTTSDTSQLIEQLSQLRDIRLPQEVSWWPLAPGWWIALSTMLALAAAAAIFVAWRRRTLKYAALRELDSLCSRSVDAYAPGELATEVSVLLRRVVLSKGLGNRFAQVHGVDWQSFLSAGPHGMPKPVARFIATAAYAPLIPTHDQIQAGYPSTNVLLDATRTWIRRNA